MRATSLPVVTLALLGSLLVPLAAPAPAVSQSHPSFCPAMTDSIVRLYWAYFGRDLDVNGFNTWVAAYRSGEKSLEDISQELADSPEFTALGNDTPERFVDWVYTTPLGSGTDPSGRDYWIDALRSGYPRGTMVLTFSESREFVAATDTTVPLAGYLRWYPRGTHWYCDIGSATMDTPPLTGGGGADFYFKNRSEAPDQVGLWTLDDGGARHVAMNDQLLQPGFTDYNWDGQFSGDGDYGRAIEVQAGSTTDWIVVFYPDSIGSERLGWQIS